MSEEELFNSLEGRKVGVTLPKAELGGVDYFANSLIDDLEEKGFEVVEIEFPSKSYPILEDTLNTARDLKNRVKEIEKDIDCLILTDYNHCLGFNPKRINPEIFLTVHHLTFPGNPFQRIIHRINIRRLKQADHIIAASESTSQKLKREYGLSSIIYDQGVKDLPEGELPAEVEKPFILYVGNHRPRKNIPLMLETFEKVAKNDDEVSLVLAGNHRGAGEAKEIIEEKNLEGRVVITGKVSEEELGALYRKADLYLHTATEEGYSRTIREAKKKGTNVVAVENSINRSILQEEEMRPPESDKIAEAVVRRLKK